VYLCEGVSVQEATAKGNSAQRFCSNKLIVLCAAHKQEQAAKEQQQVLGH